MPQSKKIFWNGFDSWMETHHEIVTFIALSLHKQEDGEIIRQHERGGTHFMYALAKEWTDEWELKHIDVKWDSDERDYWTEIEEWLKEKNKL